jgi:purine catabolism regulator
MLTIRDIVDTPGFGVGVAAGVAGLENPIRWIHVSELRDPTPWLEGGELLLTTGLGLGASPARQVAYARRLASAGLAGLGLGVGLGFDAVPNGIVTVADRLGFPVLTIPYELPFIAVTKFGFSRLVGEQLELVTDALAVHERLAAIVLEGGGLEPLLNALHDCLGCSLRVVDRGGRVLGERRGTIRSPGWQDAVVELPVGGHGEAAAVLQASPAGESFSEYDLLVLHHGQTAVSFELSRRRAVSATELRLAGDLFEDLEHDRLEGGEIDRRLAAFGLDPASGCASVVATPAAGLPIEQVRQGLARELDAVGVTYLSTARPDTAAFLVEVHDEEGVLELANRLAALGTAERIGVGRPASGRALRRSLAEARAALEAAKPVASYRDLGPMELILGLPDAALEAFVDRVLGDAAGNRALVDSLSVLLDCGCRWSEAAARLGVHRHTLRYRMDRLRERTGRHPDDPGDRMELWLAVKAMQVLARCSAPAPLVQAAPDAASTSDSSRIASPSSMSLSSARIGTSTRSTLP